MKSETELLEKIKLVDDMIIEALKAEKSKVMDIIAECNSGAYSALYAVERLTEVLGSGEEENRPSVI